LSRCADKVEINLRQSFRGEFIACCKNDVIEKLAIIDGNNVSKQVLQVGFDVERGEVTGKPVNTASRELPAKGVDSTGDACWIVGRNKDTHVLRKSELGNSVTQAGRTAEDKDGLVREGGHFLSLFY
jgi:hypothetical protein